MISKKNSRNIVVNSIKFRYAVSNSEIDGDAEHFRMNIIIQSESNGRKLIVNGITTRDIWLDFSEYPKDHSLYSLVTPKHIDQFIKLAIEKGWSHSESGKNFHLNVDNNSVGNIMEQ